MGKKEKDEGIVPTDPIHSDSHLALPAVQRIPEFVEFARWCATPSWSREPPTQNEFAESFDLSPDTLTDWKRHPEFWPLVWQFVLERMKEQVPDVVERLYAKITSGKGSVGDVQLFLRMASGESKTTDKK